MPQQSEALVGRQPIFDRKLDVHGYELLFRGEGINPEDPEFADFATSKVIVNSFTEHGLDSLVSGKQAFVNLTRSFLVGDLALPFDPKGVVLEVLETVHSEPEVLAGIEKLKQRGFTIALDDFVFEAGCEPLIELADLIKLDVLDLEDEVILAQVEQLRPFNTKLLAEKIETREQFESCKAMGFEYFQGFFLERPTVVRKKSVDPRSLTLLALLSELHSPSFTFNRAEEIVKQDLGLCYRLLSHINSVLYGMPRKVTCVREALVYLGIDNVQNLTSLFLLVAKDDTPQAMIINAMMRARMCEELARAASERDSNQYFVVGLFSTLDALMELPMSELLERLPISAIQKAALAGEPGSMSDTLRTVIAYEHCDWDNVGCLDLPLSTIKESYMAALKWAEIVSKSAPAKAA
jgi:EAL and modified HD-GYP domain-containing signal transduction protein